MDGFYSAKCKNVGNKGRSVMRNQGVRKNNLRERGKRQKAKCSDESFFCRHPNHALVNCCFQSVRNAV